jgi:hypothetical protein
LPVEAVILYRTGDATANTTAPGSLFPHNGWDYEGIWGGNLGTPIAPHFFISAAHIGQAGGSNFTFQNVNYTVLQGFYDPASDLVIWRIAQTFPTFAPLYSRQDEVGQTLVEIGRGSLRGAEYFLNNTFFGWLGEAMDLRAGEKMFSAMFFNISPFGICFTPPSIQTASRKNVPWRAAIPAAEPLLTMAGHGNWPASITE